MEDHHTGRVDIHKFFQREFGHFPGGTSVRNVNHWVQHLEYKKFNQFDFGKEENLKKYGTADPPEYDLSKFKNYTVPSLFFTSNSDPYAKSEDVEHLFQYFKNKL